MKRKSTIYGIPSSRGYERTTIRSLALRLEPGCLGCHLLEEDIRLCMRLPRYRIMRVGRFRHLVPVVSPDRVDVAVVVE